MAPRSRVQIQFAAALAVAAAVVIYVIARHPSSSGAGPSAVAASASAHYEVDGQKGAHWKASQSGGTTRVALDEGEAAFHVEHLAKEQRFLVALPDGEVEVRGTRFVVSVDHGQTRRVQVTEGRVALRLADVRERELYAGEAWERTREPAGATSAASPPVTAPSGAPVGSAAPAAAIVASAGSAKLSTASAQTMVAGASMTATPAPTAPAAPAAPTATVNGGHFADAMSLFRAGRYAEADAAFASFESAAPGDPRAEDAAWLRAVAKSRTGDAAGAAKQAQRYLDRYPQGLRRNEAEALAKGNKP